MSSSRKPSFRFGDLTRSLISGAKEAAATTKEAAGSYKFGDITKAAVRSAKSATQGQTTIMATPASHCSALLCCISFEGVSQFFSEKGVSIRNNSEIDLLVILSQVGPLYWNTEPLKPGETWHRDTGKVWFTVAVLPFEETLVPTTGGTVAKAAVKTVAGAALVPASAWAAVGAANMGIGAAACEIGAVSAEAGGLYMVMGSVMIAQGAAAAGAGGLATYGLLKITKDQTLHIQQFKEKGVYADGKTVIIRGQYTVLPAVAPSTIILCLTVLVAGTGSLTNDTKDRSRVLYKLYSHAQVYGLDPNAPVQDPSDYFELDGLSCGEGIQILNAEGTQVTNSISHRNASHDGSCRTILGKRALPPGVHSFRVR